MDVQSCNFYLYVRLDISLFEPYFLCEVVNKFSRRNVFRNDGRYMTIFLSRFSDFVSVCDLLLDKTEINTDQCTVNIVFAA
jgi:hypothetical protein